MLLLISLVVNNPNPLGKKMFVNNLSTSELSCSGLINGIDTNQIITLSTDQRIPGETVADNLEIVEKLQVSTSRKFNLH